MAGDIDWCARESVLDVAPIVTQRASRWSIVELRAESE
jgi:hypothetical protein